MASLYVAVIKYGLSGNDQEVGWGRYFFAAGYEYTWFSVAKAYAVALHTKSLVDTGDPVAISVTKVPVMRYALLALLSYMGLHICVDSLGATLERSLEGLRSLDGELLNPQSLPR